MLASRAPSPSGGPGARPHEGDPAKLADRRILLVEDEILIAIELEMALEDAGAVVVGPIPGLAAAIEAARTADVAAAILDIDLAGHDVFPAADILRARGVPFVFHTGHGRRVELGHDYPAVPVCKKPMSGDRVVRILAGTL